MSFCNVDLVKPAFEFCTQIAHVRIMYSPTPVCKLQYKSVKLQQSLNWETNIEVNISGFQKLPGQNVLFYLEFMVYNAYCHMRLKLWLTKT